MNNQTFSKIWIIVIIAAILAGGILAWQYWLVPREEVKRELETIEIKDETTDWKIYRNEEYGFEIKYPQDWKTEEKEYRWITGVKPYVSFQPIRQRLPEEILVSVYTIRIKDPEEPYLPSLNEEGIPLDQRGFPMESVEIKGRIFYKEVIKFEAEHTKTYLTFDNKERIGHLTFIVRGGRQRMDYYIPEREFKLELEIFNQMLSTFRFLE